MPSIGWYLQRLRAMSPPEVLFRVQRSVAARIDHVPWARPSIPEPDLAALRMDERAVPRLDVETYIERAERALRGRIDVFAKRDHVLGDPPDWNRDPRTGRAAPVTPGKLIDYRDENIVGNIKYLWEPGRHLMLPSLAQAYRLTGDRKYLQGLARILDSWMKQCPYPNGVHWCSSLELGIRLINWSYCWQIVGDKEAWTDACLEDGGIETGFLGRWLASIYLHQHFIDRYYSAYSSANNHLIGEAAGVYVAAATWPAWSTSERWRCRARDILLREIETQTHPDGVNAEQAIAYQQFVLDFFVIAGLAAGRTDDPFPPSWWASVEQMLQFVASMMDVKGNMPMIGDADDGFVLDLSPEPEFCNFRSLLNTGAILMNRPDFAAKSPGLDDKTAWLIDNAEQRLADVTSTPAARVNPTRIFPEGGYYLLGSNLDSDDEVRIVMDAGPLGMGSLAAHGHADALSFSVSVGGCPLLIDPGTFAYHTDKIWRDYFRGTSAHNTARIDTLDQSEIAGNFMWSRHAKVTVNEVSLDGNLQYIEASHDGYLRLQDPVTHCRRLTYEVSARKLLCQDSFDCRGKHDVELFFHIPEYADMQRVGDVFVVTARDFSLTIVPDVAFESAIICGDDQLPLGWISYRFDVKTPSITLRLRKAISGPSTVATAILVA